MLCSLRSAFALRRLSISVLGAQFDKGQPHIGTSDGPDAIRQTGVIAELERMGHDIIDLGNVAIENIDPRDEYVAREGCMKNATSVGTFNQKLAHSVHSALGRSHTVLTLGGDHSLAIGTVSGHARALQPQQRLSVLWVDAHADINTSVTSTTGHFHGKCVSFLTHGLGARADTVHVPPLAWTQPVISPERLVYIGVRDLDPLEHRILTSMNISVYSVRDLDTLGVDKVTEMALAQLHAYDPQTSLHVSFDIDSLDPLEAPSTGTPVRGGLSLREAQQLMERVSEACGPRVTAIDLVEVNPRLGTRSDVALTCQAARHVILSLFGNSRLTSGRSCL